MSTFCSVRKNRAVQSVIDKSSYKAMFGAEARVGLATCLPLEMSKILESEEYLPEFTEDVYGETTFFTSKPNSCCVDENEASTYTCIYRI